MPDSKELAGRNILETERLVLREMTWEDYRAICKILQDKETMYAYEHAFPDEEARRWLQNQLNRYEEYGIGLWAVALRETGEVIGQCGLTWQQAPKELYPTGRAPRLFHHPREQLGIPACGRKKRHETHRKLFEALLWNGYAAYHICGGK